MPFDDYPPQQSAASECAVKAQQRHFQLTKLQVGLLLAVSIDSAVSWGSLPGWRLLATLLVAVFLVLALASAGIVATKKYDRTWFICRSIAESTKAESWRYMMKVKPYETDDVGRGQSFVSQLKDIIDEQDKPIPVEFLADSPPNGEVITVGMKGIRSGSLPDRLETYSRERVGDQERWYQSKAKENLSMQSRWFAIYWVLFILSCVLAIVEVGYGTAEVNPVGAITTATAGVLSWSQTRRYSELAKSYGLTSKQLTFIRQGLSLVRSESDLAQVVSETEQTISREHSVWLIRRL